MSFVGRRLTKPRKKNRSKLRKDQPGANHGAGPSGRLQNERAGSEPELHCEQPVIDREVVPPQSTEQPITEQQALLGDMTAIILAAGPPRNGGSSSRFLEEIFSLFSELIPGFYFDMADIEVPLAQQKTADLAQRTDV